MSIPPTLEGRLALLLGCGTWLACAVIAAGLSARLLRHDAAGDNIITAGIGLIIALPVLRLVAMLEYFHAKRHRKFSAICALVLVIVAGAWYTASLSQVCEYHSRLPWPLLCRDVQSIGSLRKRSPIKEVRHGYDESRCGA